MRFSTQILAWSAVSQGVLAQTPGGSVNSPEAALSFGTGLYPAIFFEEPSLRGHTIYQPARIPPNVKMPVLVWGNGGCLGVGTLMMPFLVQIASQGIVVIANGSPGNVTGTFDSFANATRTKPEDLTNAINWAVIHEGSGNFTHMTTSRLGVAGQSCGGVEAEAIARDKRVTTVGIFNSGSGLISPVADFSGLTTPIFFFLGGETDIAFKQGEMDYGNLPDTVPAWKGNLPVGHGGTYNEVNGGKIGVAASYMYKWLLLGNETAGDFFRDGNVSRADGWDAVSKNLDKVSLKPLSSVSISIAPSSRDAWSNTLLGFSLLMLSVILVA